MTQPTRASISKGELTALIAMMFATIAFSIDAMLPALPEIAAQISPDDVNKAQLILTVFVLGMGLGTFITGPMSDAYGRKSVILVGAVIYSIGALLGASSDSLELIVFARFLMGLGAAGPRVVALTIARDMFKGREMAQVMSYAMMIFTLVPAIAPALGAMIILLSGWRSIFIAFVVFAGLIIAWSSWRLPETLAPENRRKFDLATLWSATCEVIRHATSRNSILVQTLCMGVLFSMLTSVQQVYGEIYDRADSFPYWFGMVALVAGAASMLNAKIVIRIGMRPIVFWSLAFQTCCSLVIVAASMTSPDGNVPFYLFVTWQCTVFLMVGTTLGNLNALAMEPLGHIAGSAASVIGSVSTVCAILIATPIGALFDGTLRPLSIGMFVYTTLGVLVMLRMLRGNPHVAPAE